MEEAYKWAFRLAGIVLLGISLFFYFRNAKGICTLDAAKRRKNEIINTISLAVIAGVISYIIWLYVVVEYAGKWLHIWK